MRMNAEWCNLNGNIRNNEWQMVEANTKRKNNRRGDPGSHNK
jgi:hypothetical protein